MGKNQEYWSASQCYHVLASTALVEKCIFTQSNQGYLVGHKDIVVFIKHGSNFQGFVNQRWFQLLVWMDKIGQKIEHLELEIAL